LVCPLYAFLSVEIPLNILLLLTGRDQGRVDVANEVIQEVAAGVAVSAGEY
jgi:hypothetical protein